MVEQTKADKIIMKETLHYGWAWINSLWFWLRFRRDVKLS